MDVRFKNAEPIDIETLVTLMSEYYTYDHLHFEVEAVRAALVKFINDETLGVIWLVQVGQEAVGYVALTLGYSLEYLGRDAFIDEIYIREAYRGQGLGRKAINLAEETCRAWGVNALHLEVEHNNVKAQAFYRQVGFEDHERYLLTKWLLPDKTETTVNDFYDQLTPFYHLIFQDWEQSIERQATQLDGLIKEHWGQIGEILDVSCGIGTQTIGLAQRGYRLTASDLSAAEIKRAKQEAAKRGLSIDFSVADMREAYDHHHRQFDVVISADNSMPHLLTDADILTAFRQFYACLRPGGGCLITVRDYDQIERSQTQVKPYGLRVENGIKYIIFQVWEFSGDLYDLSMYFISDNGTANCSTQVMRTKYYAVSTARLIELMYEAGFVEAKRVDGRFYQPVIVGTK